MNAALTPPAFGRLAEDFRAWRLPYGSNETIPIVVAAVTMQAAISEAQQRCQHKDLLLIECSDVRSGTMLHGYALKQSSSVVRVPHEDGTWRYIRPLKAVEQFAFKVNEFSPVEPWRWSRGCDVVGADLQELRA